MSYDQFDRDFTTGGRNPRIHTLSDVSARSDQVARGNNAGMDRASNFLNACFPDIHIKSSIVLLTIFDFAVYFFSLVWPYIVGMHTPNWTGGLTYPAPCVLYVFGAGYTPAIMEGQVWRLVTPIFLHTGLLHIMLNMLFQLQMGCTQETLLGKRRIMLLYFISGMFGNLVDSAFSPASLSAGASSSLFGLAGLRLAYVTMVWNSTDPNTRDFYLYGLVAFVVANVLLTMSMPGIALWSHLGGFIAGGGLGLVVLKGVVETQPSWYSTATICANALLALIAVGCIIIIVLTVDPRNSLAPACA